MSTAPPVGLVLAADGRPLDVIHLHGLQVDCVIGHYRAERGRTQPIELAVSLFLDTRPAGAREELRATVDYARVAGELRFLLESASFRLLETAAQAMCRYLLAPPTADGGRASIEAVSLRLTKPQALRGQAVPSLSVFRRRDEFAYAVEEKPFGRVDVIFEDSSVGIYRLRIAPGRSIPTHEHRFMEESELVLSGGLLLQGRPVRAGTGFRWPLRHPHRYDNPRGEERTILCVDRPAFQPDDEVEVPEPPGGLVSLPGTSYYPPEAGPGGLG